MPGSHARLGHRSYGDVPMLALKPESPLLRLEYLNILGILSFSLMDTHTHAHIHMHVRSTRLFAHIQQRNQLQFD